MKRKIAKVAGIWDSCDPDLVEDKIRIIKDPLLLTTESVKKAPVFTPA